MSMASTLRWRLWLRYQLFFSHTLNGIDPEISASLSALDLRFVHLTRFRALDLLI